ncbi:M24 family metallopeptidase [Brevibacillus fulvus]|uniref:Xaa-Pro aminopeptidase n=1 Tax=Brevibacillus fulvus TaxID=1125967 RepID=A0A939BR91_9BACL|nr:M24 family metallopeptidase [Brevibacillus fulvus]MBM7589233.1 Xaa-Pro aminopeptidase [Brevibacillus fulvus]
MKDFQQKVEQLRKLLRAKQLDGLLIGQQKNFSWLTGGRSFVNLGTERAVGTIFVSLDTAVLFASNIEAQRLIDEEVQAEFAEVKVFPWHLPGRLEQLLADWTEGKQVLWDSELEAELSVMRSILSDDEQVRIRSLARETAEALEQTARQISIGETEYEIAARLAANCIARGIEPIVNLVGTDQRIFQRRHPLPTTKRLERYAMLVVGGRRQGQIVSCTRLVHFGQPPAELERRLQAVATVDAALILSTVPGKQFEQLFATLQEVYQTVGFANEWQHHHQGGLSGYLSREQLLLPGLVREVQANQAFAWNPSISGVKSEDTILVTANGPEILTFTGQYPTVEAVWNGSKLARPGILVR